MRLLRTSLAFIMGVASTVTILLIGTAAAVVTCEARGIARAVEQQRAASRLREAAFAMRLHLHDQAGSVWRTVHVADARGRAQFANSTTAFRADLQEYARSATSDERRALLQRITALHGDYTAHGIALLAGGESPAASGQGAVSAGTLRFVALQEELEREIDGESERLAAIDVRNAQENLLAQVSRMLTALTISGIGLLVAPGIGFLAIRHYTLQTVRGFTTAVDALEAEDEAFHMDWRGAAEFLPLAARFNDIQQRLAATTAIQTRLASRESEIQAANAALNTEIAASAEMLRVVQKAASAWRHTFDAVDFVLMTVDRSGTVQRVNRAALALLGGRFEDWIGRPLGDLPDRQPWNAIGAAVRSVIASGTPLTTHIDEGKVWEVVCTGFTPDDDFSVVWARDITSTAELQRAVARSEAMGAMGELLGGVAHEVRNPLFAITALLDAWSLKPVMKEGPFLPMLRHEVTRMLQLMEELLEYGRPFNSLLLPGDLSTVASEAVSILAPAACAREVRIECDVSGQVRMDKARMLRVFLNLVQNAIDHSAVGAIIHVTSRELRTEPPMLQIEVRDHGPGFRPDDLPRVFTPFFTRRPGGIGLGLPIVHRILDEHRGRVRVSNHPDGGALIVVELPSAAGAGPA